jgi:hypothetical protein
LILGRFHFWAIAKKVAQRASPRGATFFMPELEMKLQRHNPAEISHPTFRSQLLRETRFIASTIGDFEPKPSPFSSIALKSLFL